MKIIEYNNDLAAKVADMWNKSSSNWGNEVISKTAKDVINEESQSGNLKLYLAEVNNEIVGYCSFSQYQYDEGASYLSLLNVRPDYHGKKIGKTLILKTLETAKKAPWPRFDLFTWSGNIKAMPLYKKCGFFWEKNNDSVHLMNFIPYLHQTEAIKEYLDELDCYKDSKRMIDMNQDGSEINGFDFYRYHFENETTKIITDFERTGRGLTYLETNDYRIKMSLPNHKLVYEEEYEVQFEISNISGKNLDIKLVGNNNKNIVSKFEETFNVLKEVLIKKKFKVNKSKEKLDKFMTHPVVEVFVYINGKKSVFKCGVLPKRPVSLDLILPEYNHTLNKEYSGYLDMENNMSKETKFKVVLPDKYILCLNELEVVLKPNEKRSLEVKYIVREFGFINDLAIVKYNNHKIETEVKAIVKGHEGIIHAEEEYYKYLFNGNFMLRYVKEQNRFYYIRRFEKNPSLAFMAPKLGMPYNLEFSNQKPELTYPENNVLQAALKSKTFKGVSLLTRIEVDNGSCKINYTIKNDGPKRTLSLSIPIFKSINNMYIPYDGNILKTSKSEPFGAQNLDGSLIDSNWLFDDLYNYGLTWDKSLNLTVSGWKFASEIKEITLEKGEEYKTPSFTISYAYQDFKAFKRSTGSDDLKKTFGFIKLNLDNDNPFIEKSTKLRLTNTKKEKLIGTISCDNKIVDLTNDLIIDSGLKTVVLDTLDKRIEYKRMLFNKAGNVLFKKENDTLIVNNGLIEYKVDNNYSDAVYSLRFNNHEWLDSNYPKPKERMWWGTFVGGINQRCADQEDQFVLNEPRTAEFISLLDNLGNMWEGIKTEVDFVKDEDFKGITYQNYHLTLPGIPLIYTFSNIINKSGKFIYQKKYTRFNTLKLDADKTKSTFQLNGTTFKCGNISIERSTKKLVQFKSTRDYRLSVYNKENDLFPDTQDAYTILFSEQKLNIPDNKAKQLSGDFYIFTKEDLKREYLIDLENIKFEF